MSNFKFIDVDTSIHSKVDWITTIGSIYHYDDEYITTLNEESLFPLDNSEAMLYFVQYLKTAQQNNKKIIIFGDYDCDGVCATTIAHYLLTALNIQHGYYIPNRFTEGYGLNKQRIQQAFDKGYTTIITVDNGVVAFEEIEYAQQLGMDVLISDHHTITQMPSCPLLHPDLMHESFKGLCGAGVMYELSRHFITDGLLDCLAMIATIGDLMPLQRENRRIVIQGLKQLNQYQYPSIMALLSTPSNIDETTIAFQIVPKINAIGRLDNSNPNQLVPYLLMNNYIDCQQAALQINNINQKRKELVASSSEDVEIVVNDTIVIARSTTLSSGIVGLVATSLVSKYKKPCIVFTLENNSYKGSGRSVEGFNLYNAIKSLEFNQFQSFGGHQGALGCSINESDFESFVQVVLQKCINWNVEPVEKTVLVIEQNQIDDQLMEALTALKPYDKTHPRPLFMMRNTHITQTQLLKGKYPKLSLDNGVEALSFKVNELATLMKYNWVVTFNRNVFRNKTTIQAMIEEIVVI